MNDSPKVSTSRASRQTLTLKKTKTDWRPVTSPENLDRRREKAARRADAAVPWEQFWIIWNPSAQRPQKRHGSVESAQAEVARLRAEFPAEIFHVYQCDALP